MFLMQLSSQTGEKHGTEVERVFLNAETQETRRRREIRVFLLKQSKEVKEGGGKLIKKEELSKKKDKGFASE